MLLQIDKLGKVAVTIEENYWNINKDYDKLTVVEVADKFATYISRIPVPAGTELNNRKYWIPFSSLKEEIVIHYNEWINLFGGLLTSQAEVLNNIQKIINDIYTHLPNGIIFEGDIDVCDVNESATIHLTCTTTGNKPASEIKLYKNNTLIETWHNTTYFETDKTVNSDTEFRVEAIIDGWKYYGSWNVAVVYPFYIGTGTNVEDIIANEDYKHKGSEGLNGIYQVSPNNNDNIFIIAPKWIAIPEATMGGIKIPFDNATEYVIDEIIYYVYKSSNQYQEGDYSIKIGTVEYDRDSLVAKLLNDVTDIFNEIADYDDRISEVERIAGNREESTIAPTHMGRVTLQPNVINATSNGWGIYKYCYEVDGYPSHSDILVYFEDGKYYLPFRHITHPKVIDVISQTSICELRLDNEGVSIEDVTNALSITGEDQYLFYDDDDFVITMIDGTTVDAHDIVNDNWPLPRWKYNAFTQSMINKPNTIYVIQYDFDLNGETITIPENCVLKFDGGSIKNGTLVGNNTLILNTNETESVLDNVILDGTWKESIYDLVEEVIADKAPGDGMGRIILRKDKTFAEQLTQENTIYIIMYDFTLGGNVTIPSNCVLQFEGGSLRNGTLVGNYTRIEGIPNNIFDTTVYLIGTWNIEYIDVRWFGALGDNSDSSIIVNDDAPKINHAIRVSQGVSQQGQGVPVKLHSGKYKIASPIVVIYATQLIGDNTRGSFSMPPTIIFRYGSSIPDSEDNCCIKLADQTQLKNIYIRPISTEHDIDGIVITGTSGIDVDNVNISNVHYGVSKIFKVVGAGFTGTTFNKVKIKDCVRGFSITDNNNPELRASSASIVTWMNHVYFNEIEVNGAYEMGMYFDILSLFDANVINGLSLNEIGRLDHYPLNYFSDVNGKYITGIYASVQNSNYIGSLTVRDGYIEGIYYTNRLQPIDGKYLIDDFDYDKNACFTTKNVSLSVEGTHFENCLNIITSLGYDNIKIESCTDGPFYRGSSDTKRFYLCSDNKNTTIFINSVIISDSNGLIKDCIKNNILGGNCARNIIATNVQYGDSLTTLPDVIYNRDSLGANKRKVSVYVDNYSTGSGIWPIYPMAFSNIPSTLSLINEDITITLLSNCTFNDTISIYSSLNIEKKRININLNGHTLNILFSTNNKTIFYINTIDEFIIQNGTLLFEAETNGLIASCCSIVKEKMQRSNVTYKNIQISKGTNFCSVYLANQSNFNNTMTHYTYINLIDVTVEDSIYCMCGSNNEGAKIGIFYNVIGVDSVSPSRDLMRIGSTDITRLESEAGYQHWNPSTKILKVWNGTEYITVLTNNNGVTRPSDPPIGYCFFDTSSGIEKPIWYKGNNIWVDATGTPV